MSEYAIPADRAIARLDVIDDYDPGNGPGPCVHSFAQSPFGMLGAHWYASDVEALIREHGAEEAGEVATSMGHGIVVTYEDGGRSRTLFFATRDPAPTGEAAA